MRIATVKVVGTMPISFGRMHEVPKLNKESPADYEARTWRAKAHYTAPTVDVNGVAVPSRVFVPPMMLKNSLARSVQYSGDKIVGKGAKGWTEKFRAGVHCFDSMFLEARKDPTSESYDEKAECVTADELAMQRVFVPSDGKAGSGKRVWKSFPILHFWQGTMSFRIYDDQITTDVFAKYIVQMGDVIGMGRFRPINGGMYGRFNVLSIEIKELDLSKPATVEETSNNQKEYA